MDALRFRPRSPLIVLSVMGLALGLIGAAGINPASLPAQVSPQIIDSTTVADPVDVATADLDGDGDQDLLSASWDDHKIAWYEQTGQAPDTAAPRFGSQQLIASTAAPATSVTTADLDGDGDLDVIAASADRIVWHENQTEEGEHSPPTFGPPQEIASKGATSQSVTTADLDEDGNPDVLAAAGTTIVWYKNQSDSFWFWRDWFGKRKTITTTATKAESVVAADLDGDGDKDALAAADDTVAWYENQTGEDGRTGYGDGFGNPRVITAAVEDAQSVAAADLDGDDAREVLSASQSELKVAWHDNRIGAPDADSDGFGPPQALPSTSIFQPVAVATPDLDGDGTPDVLSAGKDELVWHDLEVPKHATDSLRFSEPTTIASRWNDGADPVAKMRAVAAADLTGNGRTDVLSASAGKHKIAWYANQGDTTSSDGFGPQQILTTSVYDIKSVAAADLNGDGRQDVLSASKRDEKIAWYPNQRGTSSSDDDGFGTQHTIVTDASVRAATLADLDNDGDPEVLYSAFGLAWHDNQIGESNSGGDAFGDRKAISKQTGTAVASADLDGDGDPDALSAGVTDLVWHENQIGERAADRDEFGRPQVVTSHIEHAESIAVADLDGDGDPDVLATSGGENKITWYENQIDERGLHHDSFGPQRVIDDRLGRSGSVTTADLNDDGAPEVLSVSNRRGKSKVIWYENRIGTSNADSDGFGPQHVITTKVDNARLIAAADLNADGHPDVLSASEYDQKMAWYENQTDEQNTGRIAFGSQQVITSQAHRPQSIATAHLDGDGARDLLLGSFKRLVWYETPVDESDRDTE